jgi:hypothetical protein
LKQLHSEFEIQGKKIEENKNINSQIKCLKKENKNLNSKVADLKSKYQKYISNHNIEFIQLIQKMKNFDYLIEKLDCELEKINFMEDNLENEIFINKEIKNVRYLSHLLIWKNKNLNLKIK